MLLTAYFPNAYGKEWGYWREHACFLFYALRELGKGGLRGGKVFKPCLVNWAFRTKSGSEINITSRLFLYG